MHGLYVATPAAGHILVYDSVDGRFENVSLSGDGSLTSAGALTVSDDSHAHTSSTLPGTTSYLGSSIEGSEITNDTVVLTTDTAGNYVASITNGSGISGGNGGSEGAALTLALGALTSDWSQTGAYDISLANAGSELKIMESAGAT